MIIDFWLGALVLLRVGLDVVGKLAGLLEGLLLGAEDGEPVVGRRVGFEVGSTVTGELEGFGGVGDVVGFPVG